MTFDRRNDLNVAQSTRCMLSYRESFFQKAQRFLSRLRLWTDVRCLHPYTEMVLAITVLMRHPRVDRRESFVSIFFTSLRIIVILRSRILAADRLAGQNVYG